MCGCKGKCGCNITSTTKGEKGDASSAATLGYKVYVALLTQSGTSAPTATILENTIGNIVWSYTSVGLYTGTLAAAFTANKTTVNCTTTNDASGSQLIGIGNFGINTVLVSSSNIGTATPVDDSLLNTFIEIRVYN